MSRSELDRFFADIQTDTALKDEVRRLMDANQADAVVALASGRGYAFTDDDVRALAGSKEVSDADLGRVAGGIRVARNPKSPFG